MDKKQNERAILDLVYGKNEIAEIQNSEQPDFWLKRNNSKEFFGVEITEFHYSQSTARLAKIPSYLDEIIYQERYRDKKDMRALEPRIIKFTSTDGTERETRGIVSQVPSSEQYSSMIAERIKEKNGKFSEYEKQLDHINLIILDAEKPLRLSSPNDFFKLFFGEYLISQLYESEFREIFLVTIANGNRRVYFPLKMILLFAEFFRFGKAISEYTLEPAENGSSLDLSGDLPFEAEFMTMFSKYPKSKTKKVYLSDEQGKAEAIFGNAGILLQSENLLIHDYYDSNQNAFIQVVNEDDQTHFFASSEFNSRAKEILETATFYTDMAYDVKGDLTY